MVFAGASTLLFSQGSGPVLLRNVRCRGSESSLLECTWSGGSTSGCTYASDLGIRCRSKCCLVLVMTKNINTLYFT